MNGALRAGSGRVPQYPVIKREIEMLARRFTIVCLILAIFGMGLASLVAEAGLSRKTQALGVVVPCISDNGPRCGPAELN